MMESASNEDNSDEEGLQIVIESPRPKKRTRKELDDNDREIIASVYKEFEETLEEKAVRANLKAQQVKNILKEVVKNEHVMAFVRQAENPTEINDLVYEPKCTRAKAKLLSNNNEGLIPWTNSNKKPSGVHVLFSEELQEDSSGDEYVPEAETSFTESLDASKSQIDDAQLENEATIALRTRSKLSLSHKPLEEIEEAFMPPDITTDMYDMDCDDDVWKEFLKTFTRPLEEVAKATEDEEHDPEYNVLADEEMDVIDREELRADRAVTVSRKEFNCLMTELFEYADLYESNKNKNKQKNDETVSFVDDQNRNDHVQPPALDNDPNVFIKPSQLSILEQQMRQHVQMLTQNFLLTYEHCEYNDMAGVFKNMLQEFKSEKDSKTSSFFDVTNLESALEIIRDWEEKFEEGGEDVIRCKEHVEKQISASIQAKISGTFYVVTFPLLVMKTIAESNVFAYPNLLPRIPFKCSQVTRSTYYYFTPGQENLVALFLEHCLPQIKQDGFHLKKSKKLKMTHVCYYIQRLLMPFVDIGRIYRFLVVRRAYSEDNPIKYFYQHRKAPPFVHYVTYTKQQLIPPNLQSPEVLPHLWRLYIYPDWEKKVDATVCTPVAVPPNSIILISPVVNFWNSPNVRPQFPQINCAGKHLISRLKSVNKSTVQRKRGPKPKILTNTIIEPQLPRHVVKALFTKTMLPDMPSLGGTPTKSQPETETIDKDKIAPKSINFQNYRPEGVSFEKPKNVEETKDNPDDINHLMIASSTVKIFTKKEPSGAEKKRAKLRREYKANLAMTTPEDPDVEIQREESFAESYFEKILQTLDKEEYNKLIEILSNYDGRTCDFIGFYTNVQSVFLPKYPELNEEFLMFLNEIQAHSVGQLIPYLIMKDMNRFISKLQIYFKDQPTQMKKVLKLLTELSDNHNCTMETVKTTILPLLKGSAALSDWFLQIFPTERPPNILASGPHESIDLSKELARQPDEEIYETIVVPNTEDPYGGSHCICTCHNVENLRFKSRTQHCKRCGLKFIQGKPYIQGGKALRPGKVSFLTNPDKDHTERLVAGQCKRSETSPNKTFGSSPSKDNHTHDDVRNSNESEEDAEAGRKKRLSKTPRKTNIKEKSVKAKRTPKTSKNQGKKTPRKRTKSIKKDQDSPEVKPGAAPGQKKRTAEGAQIEYTVPVELVELKVSSDHSGESATECCESSQDATNTDSDELSDTSTASPKSPEDAWSREEDKIILQTFRQSSNNEATFEQISKLLPNRTLLEIKSRFHKLMNLLQQMASSKN